MSLHIAIDARRINDFGVGTYIRNLVQSLGAVDPHNHYTLIISPADQGELSALPANFEVATYGRNDSDPVDHIAFPAFLRRIPADLFHMPVNRVAFLMRKPYVVTIHDMSSLLFDSRTGWRNSLRLYRFRRGLLRANRVIAVSAATQRDVENLMGVPPERIRLVYSAPSPEFFQHRRVADARAAGPDARELERQRILERYQIHYPFLLYAGAIRPQKNIPPLPEVVGDAAMLVNPENVFDIARGIKEVLLDEKLREHLSEAGRIHAARYSWKNTAQQVLEIYREIAR